MKDVNFVTVLSEPKFSFLTLGIRNLFASGFPPVNIFMKMVPNKVVVLKNFEHFLAYCRYK